MQMRFSFVVSPFEGEKCSFSLSLSSFARDFPRDDGGGDDDLVRSVNRGNIERLIFFSSFLFLFIDDKMEACDKSIISYYSFLFDNFMFHEKRWVWDKNIWEMREFRILEMKNCVIVFDIFHSNKSWNVASIKINETRDSLKVSRSNGHFSPFIIHSRGRNVKYGGKIVENKIAK